MPTNAGTIAGPVVDAARPDVPVPERFAVVRELGAGGMGTVYEALDRDLDLHVALKILHEGDGDAIEKLKHEFRVAADVRHENLVRLGELFEHDHRWCFSMERDASHGGSNGTEERVPRCGARSPCRGASRSTRPYARWGRRYNVDRTRRGHHAP